LNWNRNSVDRLFDLGHGSRIEQIDAAFQALGREVEIEVRDAA
jgi:antitoxin HicB